MDDWGEERVARRIREDEHARGRPRGCDFQAGFYQCPNVYNVYALIRTTWTDSTGRTVYGWRCKDCGTRYPEIERQ